VLHLIPKTSLKHLKLLKKYAFVSRLLCIRIYRDEVCFVDGIMATYVPVTSVCVCVDHPEGSRSADDLDLYSGGVRFDSQPLTCYFPQT
jgi:hypothetical protein